MKPILVFFTLSFAGLSAVDPQWTAEDREREAKQVAMWENNLLNAHALPPGEKFETLALGLRNMGHRSTIPGHSPAVESIYKKLQNEFLSIPGHAKYFLNKIKEGETKVREGEMSLASWDNLLMEAAGTLAHMPGEETVEVLRSLGRDRFGDPNSQDPAERDPTGNGPRDLLGDSSYPVPDHSSYNALGSPWADAPTRKVSPGPSGGGKWTPASANTVSRDPAYGTRRRSRGNAPCRTRPRTRPGAAQRLRSKSPGPWPRPTIAAPGYPTLKKAALFAATPAPQPFPTARHGATKRIA